MAFRIIIFAGMVAAAASITVSSNGNSPERKIDRRMNSKSTSPISITETSKDKTNFEKSPNLHYKASKLSINERYRRLIPYMTFYYANDLASPPPDSYSDNNVEIHKAQIVENTLPPRNAKKIVYNDNRQIPRYQGNRLTKNNIASANPTVYAPFIAPTQAVRYNPLHLEQAFMNGHTFGRHSNTYNYQNTQQQSYRTRKPQAIYQDNSAGIPYYVPEKEQVGYKFVPYEQTSSIRFTQPPTTSTNIPYYNSKKNIPVPVITNQNYLKPQRHPSITFEKSAAPQLYNYPKPETYYERSQKPIHYEVIQKLPEPEGGFRPMTPSRSHVEEQVRFIHTTTVPEPARVLEEYQNETPDTIHKPSLVRTEYYEYRPHTPPTYTHEYVNKHENRDSVTLSEILATLQRSKSIPHPITKENVGSSIRTLLQVLNVLKANSPHHNEVEAPVLSTPMPFVATQKTAVDVSPTPVIESASESESELHREEYLAPVNTPSQHLDDYRGTSQTFPLPIASEDDGGTPGRAGVDYPILTTIPETAFDCKTQRYKGFFADPETKCQVWHYCDLNGGQASFLCPNGTIFSQQALTCDWWFNVRCDSTHQLYVLNERLYKYILPHQPKFPEDFNGPLVDKYLALKYKEMEEQFRKNKQKLSSSDNEDSTDQEIELESGTEPALAPVDAVAPVGDIMDTVVPVGDLIDPVAPLEAEAGTSEEYVAPPSVSESSVVVESPGNSGNVQRLDH